MAKFKVGDKVKVYHGTKEGKVLSVEEGMRSPIYKVQLGTLHGVPFVSMFEEKELVAANAVCACNANIETLVSDLDKGKYDQLNWMPKVIGKGSLYPDGMKFPTGFGYDDEEKVRQAWMSGKYASVIVYKGGSKRGELTINSRARNAAGYVDASSVVLHPGDAVVFKAQYSSHKNDDEWLERNGDTVREVRGNEVKIGPSANDWAKKSDLMVWHNAARSRNAVVQKALNACARNDKQFHTYLVPVLRKGVKDYVTIERVADEETAKKLVDVPSFRIIGVTMDETRPVKVAKNAKALNYSPYRKGGWLHDDKGANYTVIEEEHWGKNGGAERFVTIRDEQTKQTKEVAVTELAHRFHMGEAEACARCGNSVARNAIGRDKQDAASVELWAGMFENNFLKFVLPKSTDKAKARKSGESIIKRVEEALGSEGGREQLKRMGWTIQKMRDALEKGLNTATARNAEDDWVERFEVGGVYHGPYMNKDWLAKVLSRTDSSIRVAIKSRRDKTWHGKDEQVTLRINKRQAEEDGTEVAKGYGWEFWANDFE